MVDVWSPMVTLVLLAHSPAPEPSRAPPLSANAQPAGEDRSSGIAVEAAPFPETPTPDVISGARAAPPPGPANDPSRPWYRLSAQVRPRAEKAFCGHLGVPRAPGSLSGEPNFRITQRTRAQLDVGMDITSARVSVQDVRWWAGESSTLSDYSGDGIDFHEAWLQVGQELALRVGRQTIALDGQRLIGAVNWSQQGRVFDAARLTHHQSGYAVSLIAARVPDGLTQRDPHDLFVAHGALDLSGVHVAMPLIFQTNTMVARNERTTRQGDWHRFTGGVYARGKGNLDWRVEAYTQTDTDRFAYLVGGRIGYRLSPVFHPIIWVDYSSGGSEGERSGAFDTLFATNHKFYGYMDRFTSIPRDTGGRGLIDLSLKNKGQVAGGELEIAFHEFLLANPQSSSDAPWVGAEADLIFGVPVTAHLSLMAGAAIFVDQGDFKDAREAQRPGAPTVHDWFFLMLDANL